MLPGAIDKGMTAEVAPNGTDRVRLYSVDYAAPVEFGLNEEDKPQPAWARYVFGVARELIKKGGGSRWRLQRRVLRRRSA